MISVFTLLCMGSTLLNKLHQNDSFRKHISILKEKDSYMRESHQSWYKLRSSLDNEALMIGTCRQIDRELINIGYNRDIKKYSDCLSTSYSTIVAHLV